jgi:hypothetical protein
MYYGSGFVLVAAVMTRLSLLSELLYDIGVLNM